MAKPTLALVSLTIENRTVGPLRRPNADFAPANTSLRPKSKSLIEAAKGNRHGHRDATMMLLAFRHGFRASEFVALEWSQVDFATATLHVRRIKKGAPATHRLRGDEMRALRKLQRESAASPFVVTSERGAPFATAGFAKMVGGPAPRPSFPSRRTRTCCAMPAASPSPMPAMTHGRYRRILVTATFSTRSGTPS